MFKQTGFAKVKLFVRMGKKYVTFPVSIAVLYEQLLQMLPYRLRRKAANTKPFKALMKIHLAGIKAN